MVVYGCLWLSIVVYGCLLLSMVVYGCLLLSMVVYGCLWLVDAMFEVQIYVLTLSEGTFIHSLLVLHI